MRFIRVVLSRHEPKSLDSVIDKISRQRKNNPNYDFNDVDDLIGIKILCPYLSNAKEVGEWLYKKKDFTITPTTQKQAWVSRKTGYRGYHFIAEPNPGTYPDWMGLKCEIQVKTMCQEAWDAQTHDIHTNEKSLSNQNF